MEQLAKLEKVERSHRLEDVDLVVEQFPDFDHPLEPVHHHVHVRPVVVRGGFAQYFAAGRDLVQDLFEPKLVGLVDDDEEHLIVRDELSLAQAERLLQLEQALDPEVIAVILRRAFVIDGALHRRSLAQRGRGSQSAGDSLRGSRLRLPQKSNCANSIFDGRGCFIEGGRSPLYHCPCLWTARTHLS